MTANEPFEFKALLVIYFSFYTTWYQMMLAPGGTVWSEVVLLISPIQALGLAMGRLRQLQEKSRAWKHKIGLLPEY